MMNEYINECVEPSTSIDKSKEINRTYIVSATSTCNVSQINDGYSRGRLTLQRRKTNSKGTQRSEKTVIEYTEKHVEAREKRLTLQRRTRADSIDKSKMEISRSSENQDGQTNQDLRHSKILSEPNCRTPRATAGFRSASMKDAWSKVVINERIDLINAHNKTPTRFPQKTLNEPTVGKADSTKADYHDKVFSTPTKKTPFEKISTKKDVFERLAGRDILKTAKAKSGSLERQRNPGLVNGESLNKPTGQVSISRNVLVGSHGRNVTSSLKFTQVKRAPTLTSSCQNGDVIGAGCKTPGRTTFSNELLNRDSTVLKQESLKMENSAVTVAVRVRPFNSREKTDNGQQVIFMDNQETTVQHPDSKQSCTFTYDFSFCSIDKTDPNFASQKTVYEKLARPLLERAFEGFNTCLFAYGQTGSGKSYTMMGFGEEAGVTPRFCEELFCRMTQSQNNQVTCRLEMSYFEVYNEKIHDLLVVKDEQGEKKLPLRVREHPVFGPYVADLSTNVVSSYADIQGWLQLGNKQRATAATGMNDKSSRSHSVFALVMTQTKTEFVEEEEHDHTVTSRINLVDLAGSERCSSAQTSGDRLREGASINKSLLTLGKVISALSEQCQSRKKVFTPYRESVLTWLLKESLGGNSKTAMIATLSPAASSVEETLSTLRYARQARLIINIAKVNEDNNAKLIRELKAEVDKLRAAQMSTKGIEPEKMRLFQQEISALKTQLTEQEKEMAEAHKKWKEKLEQAEKRKREEAKELQKAGITFKVDNRLPNLVNLNEDPQLSEMLLYMIKEGQTKVGKHKSESAHDIQLSGALIAEEHCVICNVSGTVSITPIKDAKTFVNGNLVSEPTVLHHGDRVILGGDHYFRFNHPVEVHSGKRVSCWTQSGDGHKDFEFAKNELLTAQRAQLEAEIEEARLKAKEEMMQGIQVAKEMAQKELSDQKSLYEDKIKALERELEEENERKKQQELDKQRVASKMEKLQNDKNYLEQEAQVNKKRLHMETQATRQALADHDIRHARILEALEEEKRKIAEDLERMQKKIAQKEVHSHRNVLAPQQWDAMKLSVMIEEANVISKKLRKSTVFSRHELSDKDRRDGEGELQVQVQNTKLGISTFWSLEKFQNNLAAMRELEQGDGASKDDDVFYDPNDEWEQDISASSSASSFSRRRSRSLLKSRRISGRLYEIRVHPIQSLLSSQHTGLMGVSKPPSLHPSAPDSALPGICKDLIGTALARLWGSHGAEETMPDRLISDLVAVHAAVTSISSMYDSLDDNSQENLFVCNEEAQTLLVRATSAIERAVFITLQWSTSVKPITGPVFQTAEELKREVKKMGGYFQLLIQGCDSEISSMVTEAQSKISQCLDVAVRFISQLSAVTGTELHLTEAGSEAVGKRSLAASLYEGACRGMHLLLDDVIHQAKELQREAQITFPRTEVSQSLKKKSLDVASSLQSYVSCNQTQRDGSSERTGEDADPSHLQTARNTAAQLLQLSLAVRRLHSALTRALRDKDNDLSRSRDAICSSSKMIDDIISGLPKLEGNVWAPRLQLPCVKSLMGARDDVHSALCSLTSMFDQICVEKSKLSGLENRVGKAEEERGPDTTRRKMQWFKIISNIIIWFYHCTAKDSRLPLQGRNLPSYDESYYEYVPDRLQWHDAKQVCQKKSGALASVSSAFENMELTNYFQSLNITHQVWIEGMVLTPKMGAFEFLILQFSGRSNRKHARLLQQFPSMQSVTVCVHIQFNPSCDGLSTVFSYSVPSFINEFQLRARIVPGKPIQLALLVHGLHGPYSMASENDGLWHFVCVSWTRDKGEWVVAVDGLVVGQGDNLNPSADIGADGRFIIGQEQDTFGGSFRSEESFSGNITWLNIWDRVLNISEILALQNECSLISPGLFYKWNSSTLEIEPSLRRHCGTSPCQGNRSERNSQDLHLLLERGFMSYHNFTSVQNSVPNSGECVTFDPTTGSWDLDFCVEIKGAVCQFDKDTFENQQHIFNFPKTSLFTKFGKDPLAKSVMEEDHFDVTPENYFYILAKFGRFLLRVLEANSDLVTPIDMLYLAQVIELAAETQVSAIGNTSEAILSFAADYLKLASELIDPKMSARWLDLAEEGVALGPFSVVQSIDKLTGTLADVLSVEGKSFTLSTKNIDVHLEPRQLSQLSCSCSYKPSTFGGSANSQDEILVPDTEVFRLHSLGYKEVMFIHVYYSHLVEIQSKVHRKPSSEDYNEGRSLHTGRLATAVISATVRDFSRSQNIPVAVHYTLSSSDMVEYSWLVKPVCVFWNFSLMTEDQDGWSSEGCQVTYSGSMVTSCFCNHTTNFAVLMNYMGSKWSPEEQSVLTKLTFIGSGASLCALVVTLMLFTVLDIPKSDRMSIHKNLFSALTAAQIVLLCSGAAVGNKVACTLVAALLHLFFMAAFSWMLVEGLLLWSKVVTVNLSEERHMKYYYLIGWGLPVLIVTITLASASGQYSADGHCWLSVHNGVIWGFVGPVIFIMMVNVMVLTRVVVITISMAKRRSIMLAVNSSPAGQAYEHIRSAVKAVLVLLPILGLTWLCGVLVPFSIVIAYIFILLNSLQGLFIFLIYGVYNTEVRSTINRIKERRRALNFSNCASSRPSSSVTSSRPASSPAPGLQDHSQEEGYRTSASHLSSYSAPLDTATVLSENSAHAIKRQQSIPSANGSPEDECPSPATADIAPEQSALSKTLDGTQGGCSLHVPMEVELTSCFPLSSKPLNVCGGLYLD
ncbi:hypothetical protein SKAU_G00067510 [Synaphobranchus kaupii]|uniref:Kinesin-like protein KIF14 n=1 Tax=Synaphobranchus kaupii TaxID=118154 RepID=A0A9Q1JA80_SYNKA|nr:hypothetical protein SKAU_G00067510 [Synaphobranchus kaupii]